MELKTEFPKDCNKILKFIRRGKVAKGKVADRFKREHADYNIDWLVQNGLVKRSYIRHEKGAKIMLEATDVKCKLKQGHRCDPNISRRDKL